MEFIAFLIIILLSLFANDRIQQFVGANSVGDRSHEFSHISLFRYVDFMTIVQWISSRFSQLFCFLFLQMTDGSNLTGDLPLEFGAFSDTLDYCFLGKFRPLG